MKDQIRQAILGRAEKRWRRIHPSSTIGRFLSPIFGGPHNALWIVEHEEIDPEFHFCVGNAIAAWKWDSTGLASTNPALVDPGPVNGKNSRDFVIRFYISDNNTDIVTNEMEGPRDGTIIQFKAKPAPSGVKLSIRRAITVLKGTAIG